MHTFFLHPVYDHALNALVPPPSVAVGNINDDKQCPTGRDGPEGGGHDAPPPWWQFWSTSLLLMMAVVA